MTTVGPVCYMDITTVLFAFDARTELWNIPETGAIVPLAIWSGLGNEFSGRTIHCPHFSYRTPQDAYIPMRPSLLKQPQHLGVLAVEALNQFPHGRIGNIHRQIAAGGY